MRNTGVSRRLRRYRKFLSSLAQDFIEDTKYCNTCDLYTSGFLSSLAQDFIEERPIANVHHGNSSKFLSSLAQDFIEDSAISGS